MAETKKKELSEAEIKAAAETYGNEKVQITLPPDDNEEHMSVIINGECTQIIRGEPVMVPRYIAEVVEHSLAMQTAGRRRKAGLPNNFS